jgi:hypothetical protein
MISTFSHSGDLLEVKYSNGDRVFYRDGKFHREDGPALEFHNGAKEFYINGQAHREDGPAIEYPNWYREWRRAGCPYGISVVGGKIEIGGKYKPSIADWDEWFSGAEEFKHKRDSKAFGVLLELWAQFKEQVGEIGELRI